MNDAFTTDLDSLLLELFEEMRRADLALTLQQYDLCRQALAKGYGLGGWDDLERICRWLWVKPSLNYDENKFKRAFDRFRQQHQLQSEPEPMINTGEQVDSPKLPTLPPRRFAVSEATTLPDPPKTPLAVNWDLPRRSPLGNTQFQLQPQDFPVDLKTVCLMWRSLRRPYSRVAELELDLEATLEQFERDGVLGEIILRPLLSRQANLVVFVDKSNAMAPFLPAFQPFLQAIKKRWIAPAQVYRFINYPDQFLHDWWQPYPEQTITSLCSHWHPERTIALFWSDAGAATGSDSDDRVKGMAQFLRQLQPYLRELIWLNPLPKHRWRNTSAFRISALVPGRMIELEAAKLKTILRRSSSR